MPVAGILLAAGESSRMGQLKALLPWRGTTLVQSQAAAMAEARLDPLIAVLGHRAGELEPLLPAGFRTVHNQRYLDGKSTSIVAGVSALPKTAPAAIIVAVDQPTEAGVLTALATAAGPVVMPSVKMRRGHPSRFDRALFGELQAISEEREGLREVMVRHERDIVYVTVDTELVRANLNTPADYETAYARWGQPAS